MVKMRLFCPIFLVLGLASGVWPQDLASALKENRFIKEELALAKRSPLYFVLDIAEKTIDIKAKGIVLKEWKISKLRLWGSPPPLAAMAVLKKSSFSVPQRIKIQPGEAEGETASFELDALELKDMPSSFSLILERQTVVYVGPAASGLGSRIGRFGHFLNWYIGLPLKNLWLQIRSKPMTMIDVTFSSADEARSLYWALADKTKGLIAR